LHPIADEISLNYPGKDYSNPYIRGDVDVSLHEVCDLDR
jgi:hypothetical protein